MNKNTKKEMNIVELKLAQAWEWVKCLLGLQEEVVEEKGPEIKVSPRSTSKVVEEPAVVVKAEAPEKLEPVADKIVEAVNEEITAEAATTFVKGRFSDSEVSTIQLATGGKNLKEVDWFTLSRELNRKVDSLKSKAKQLNK
jgi:hypothetical protein